MLNQIACLILEVHFEYEGALLKWHNAQPLLNVDKVIRKIQAEHNSINLLLFQDQDQPKQERLINRNSKKVTKEEIS